MSRWTASPLLLVVSTILLAAPREAHAIPSFARKYETSCLTCHSVYPRLNPFGEAFRRNGYRFPGVDSDYVKQGTVALGQEANKKTFPNSVWPASIPISSVVAIGANGQAVVYPQKSATIPRENHDVLFSLDNLVAEGHLWAGAALDDTITIWAELTVADGGASVEHAQVLFNDLVGPKHAVNLVVGRGFPTLTSFGPHSTYLGDQRLSNLPLTGIYGLSTDPFVLVDNYNSVEATGVLAGRFDWSAGVGAGKNALTGSRVNSENVWGHVGYKLGGLRLDGEGSQGPKNALKPWAEDALTVDLFAYRSREVLSGPTATPFTDLVSDSSRTFGATVRGQLGSAELDLAFYAQRHDRGWIDPGTSDLGTINAAMSSAELSYVVFPWMVPAIRVERIDLRPTGGSIVNDLHVMPGIAFLIRANVKAVLVGNIERTNGFPTGPDRGRGSPGTAGTRTGATSWPPPRTRPRRERSRPSSSRSRCSSRGRCDPTSPPSPGATPMTTGTQRRLAVAALALAAATLRPRRGRNRERKGRGDPREVRGRDRRLPEGREAVGRAAHALDGPEEPEVRAARPRRREGRHGEVPEPRRRRAQRLLAGRRRLQPRHLQAERGAEPHLRAGRRVHAALLHPPRDAGLHLRGAEPVRGGGGREGALRHQGRARRAPTSSRCGTRTSRRRTSR